jgi:hypothetical protein
MTTINLAPAPYVLIHLAASITGLWVPNPRGTAMQSNEQAFLIGEPCRWLPSVTNFYPSFIPEIE